MKQNTLQETIRRLRQKSLNEEGEKQEKSDDNVVDEQEASIDAQINRQLVTIISNASGTKNESRDLHHVIRRLFEAEDDQTGNEEKGKGEEKTPAAPDLADAKKTVEDIDIQSVASEVTRLIDNFDSLVDFKSAVIAMTKVQLEKDYDETTIKAFSQILLDEYDVGEDRWEKETEIQPPAAVGAGSSG